MRFTSGSTGEWRQWYMTSTRQQGVRIAPAGKRREPAGQALHALLARRQVVAGVADRSDDDRRAGQPRRHDPEDVRVEAVGVHDVDAASPQVTGEADLLGQRPRTVHVTHAVLGDRDAPRLQVRV